MGRPTINSIEPYMYVAYMLNCSDNISIQRALQMSSDQKTSVKWEAKGGYTVEHRAKDIIESRIKEHLSNFWRAQQLKPFSGYTEVIDFFNKYCGLKANAGIFRRIIRWLRSIKLES